MIELGNYNTLKILRGTSVGLFLGDDDVDDLLLPNKYIPEEFEIGEDLTVFCYLDHEERPVATTLKPFIKRNEFAYLRVAETSRYGAFMDWGLEKHLLVPFREQRSPLVDGQWAVVHCHLDEKSFRLVGSTRLNRFLDTRDIRVKEKDMVEVLVSRQSDLGWDVIVNNRYRGLVYSNEVFRELRIGDTPPGFVKNIRPDGKLDIILQPVGKDILEPAAGIVYARLLEAGGTLNVHDKSSPGEIRQLFGMSKKTFKKAIGTLFREHKIMIKSDRIYTI